MHRLLDAGHRAAKIDVARLVVQVVYRRMRIVIGAENLFGLACFVRGPAVRDGHGRKDHALLVTQGDILTQFEAFGKGFADVEVDRHGPEAAVGQTHVFNDAIVIFLGQEAFERVETAVHQQLKIANLTRGQVKADQIASFYLQFLCGLIGDIEFWNRSKITGHYIYHFSSGGRRL